MAFSKIWTLDEFMDLVDEDFFGVIDNFENCGDCGFWKLKVHVNWNDDLDNCCDCPIELTRNGSEQPILVMGNISLIKNRRTVVTREFLLSYESSCEKLYLPLSLKPYLFQSRRTAERFSIHLQIKFFKNLPFDAIKSICSETYFILNQATISPQRTRKHQNKKKDIESSSKQKDKINTYCTQELANLKRMSSDLLNLLENKTSSDVSLKCDSETVSAHKLILSARSSVFETMFSSDFHEKMTGIVDIKDISPAALNSVLRYIYGGHIADLTVDLACEVTFASDKYQLPELKDTCVEFLKNSMSVETVLQILEVASLHDDHLKVCTMNFISKNIRDVKKTSKFSEIEKTNPTLMMELMKFVIDSM